MTMPRFFASIAFLCTLFLCTLAITFSNVGIAQAQVVATQPTASNTGYIPTGVTLTTGASMTISTDGTVVDGQDIQGNIIIQANNVTIKRSRIRSSFYYPIWIKSGSNFRIEDN